MTHASTPGYNCIKHPLVRKLYSSRQEEVTEAVEELIARFVPDKHEVELLHIITHADQDETFAPLWAIVVLGAVGTQIAVPFLYGILDLDDDIYNEAAQEALKKLARQYPDIVVRIGMIFIEDHFHREPQSARLFAYGPLSVLLDQSFVKEFFLMAVEQDDVWKETILHDLAKTRDSRLLEVVKRHITLAVKQQNNDDIREFKEVYCLLDGEPAHVKADEDFQSFEDRFESRDWKERWRNILNDLSDHPDDICAHELSDKKQKVSSEDHQIIDDAKRLSKIRDQYPISDFHLEPYLEIRPRSVGEDRFHELLVLLGMDELWSVEKVELLMNSQQNPERALGLLVDEVSFATPRSKELFAFHFFDLWDHTPRTEFHGVTPHEMEEFSAASKKMKVSRNELCPCGSGKKFKKCHGL